MDLLPIFSIFLELLNLFYQVLSLLLENFVSFLFQVMQSKLIFLNRLLLNLGEFLLELSLGFFLKVGHELFLKGLLNLRLRGGYIG